MAPVCVPSCSEYLQAYLDLPKAVERADFFRYLIVLRYGGLYADTDVECMSSIDNSWFDVPANTTMAVGIERAFSSLELALNNTYVRQRQVGEGSVHTFSPAWPCSSPFFAMAPPQQMHATFSAHLEKLSTCVPYVCAAAAMGVHGGAKTPGHGAAV